ncbi:hypothetical protein [Aureivirga sp. CE67]|uniref:hypothetical protein n=1 Tax=Aureivirga sp. CE67 TaxID=1788983 RepID=UPI0018CA56C6|nr:hypothetical protein [Aureivirga sp. CE67]
MLDLSNVFSGIDNIYKFLTISGLIMFCTAMIYPLQKEQILKLEKNKCEEQDKLLLKEQENLTEKVLKLIEEGTFIENSLKELSNNDSIRNKSIKIDSLQDIFNKKYLKMIDKELILSKKEINIEYNKKKITILENDISSYQIYVNLLKFPGIISFILGLIFWIRSTRISEKLKKKELDNY